MLKGKAKNILSLEQIMKLQSTRLLLQNLKLLQRNFICNFGREFYNRGNAVYSFKKMKKWVRFDLKP